MDSPHVIGDTAILLSGGIDSTALAYWQRPAVAVTIDYGQRSAEGEIRAASEVAQELSLQHLIVRINCASLGSGDLAGCPPSPTAPASEWWPYRNQLLVTFAAMRVFGTGIKRLSVGAVRSDSFHLDGTKGFFENINALLENQEGGLRVEAPALHLSSEELVETSGIPFSILAWAHSCHKASYACGNCRGCNKYVSLMSRFWHE
ncbi:MAG TPA: 7-cyano-7-deazaguanine synthase [Verrucomicrobiales bacterium]|nr:7-cyano-7-deazaguanine synthase [Verrucomicrobiales bacterium]